MSRWEEAVGLAGPRTVQDLAWQVRDAVRAVLFGRTDDAFIQRGALMAFLVRVASAGILYVSQVVLARWMGGTEYGIYVFVWTWVLVLGGLANLGMPTLMMRLLPQYREQGEFALARGLVVTGRCCVVIVASLVALAAFAALSLFGSLLSEHYLLPAFIALASIPMITLSDLQDGIGRGRGWLGAALLPPYVLRPLLVLAAMAGAHVAGWPVSAVTAAGAAVAGTWLAALVQTVAVSRKLAADLPRGPRRSTLGSWLRTSLPLLGITFSEILLQNTDVLVISQRMSPRDVGIYFAAAKTMSLVMFVHYAVGSAMAGRFAVLNARGDRAALAAAVASAVQWTFWPSLAGAAVILMAGKPLLWLFGPQFEAGYPVMFVLALGYLGRAAMGPSEVLLNMLGQQRACAIVAVGAALLDVTLSLVLVPRLGLLGAATATTVSLLAAALCNTSIARSCLGLEIAIWNNLRRA